MQCLHLSVCTSVRREHSHREGGGGRHRVMPMFFCFNTFLAFLPCPASSHSMVRLPFEQSGSSYWLICGNVCRLSTRWRSHGRQEKAWNTQLEGVHQRGRRGAGGRRRTW